MVRKQFRLAGGDAYNMKLKSPTQFEEQLTKPAEGKGQAGARAAAVEEAAVAHHAQRAQTSVKPATAIKKPYVPPAPSDEDFITVADEPADEDLY